jgi:hypothetical protein
VSSQKKFRITLWAVDTTAGTTGGWRGDQKAVVFDATAVGVEEHANDAGSAFWTLRNDHPQIAEFVPLARHYEIARWSDDRSRWEFVGAGMLNDYSVTEWETTFQGIDYKAVLNQIFTPLYGAKTGDARPLHTLLKNGIDPLNTVFDIPVSTATSGLRYFNTTAISISGPSVSAYANDIRQITFEEAETISQAYSTDSTGYDDYDPAPGVFENVAFRGTIDEIRTYWTTPELRLSWSAVWNGGSASAGFDPSSLQWRVYAYPPTDDDQGSPPLAKAGIVGDFNLVTPFQTSTLMPNGTDLGGYYFRLFPQELEAAIMQLPDTSGITPDGKMPFDGSVAIEPYDNTGFLFWNSCALRNGISYGFQIYGAILRTAVAANFWYRSSTGTVMSSSDSTNGQFEKPYQFTLGQGDENANNKITRIFSNSVTGTDSDYSRLRYSSITVINSGSTATTHTTISAGEPVLDHIANICDLEMGAKTDGSKVVFGIKKPTGGVAYDGTFQLNLSVSSAASTAIALRYPENIRSFSFTPGYSRVRNDIRVIPTTAYLAGSSGQNTGGVSLIGATAVDQSSISVNGRITLLAAKDNLLNAAAAQNEANRLLSTYKVENSKQVGIRAVLDGIDLWNGWDVGDSIRVTINQGLAIVDEPFVIAGVRWFGESDGHERIELDLVQGSAFAAAYTAPPMTTAT